MKLQTVGDAWMVYKAVVLVSFKKKPNNGEWTLGKTYQSLHWKC